MTAADREFLARILAEPDEDTHRLVYADYLDENGDPGRAGFIRATIEYLRLTRLHEDGKASAGDTGRLRAATAAWYACRWEPKLPAGVGWDKADLKQRGFVESLICPTAEWIAHGPDIVARHPVREVLLPDRGEPNRYYSGPRASVWRWDICELSDLAADRLPGHLPRELWEQDAVTEVDPRGGRTPKRFASAALGLAAFSAACLSWARAEVVAAPPRV